MKSNLLSATPMLVLLALLAIPVCLSAQNQPARYVVTDLGTLGGNYSFGYGLSDAGAVAGGAATPNQVDFLSQTGFVWKNGKMLKIGTLGGSACPDCNSEAGGPNARGVAALISETATTDPNGEDFCGFGTHRQCLGAVWMNGTMKPLLPLPGGHNTQAYWINNPGQVIGFSETGVVDPSCGSTPSQVLRYQAVIWNPNGTTRLLNPIPGDTVSFGFGINDRGQAVGTSGDCASTSLPPLAPNGTHAILWQPDGTSVDLGNLGGNAFNVATSINNLGAVAGTSLSTDGTVHPFLWTSASGIRDLGAFPGAILTIAGCCHTLNDTGEVVGFAIDPSFNMTAFIVQNGVMTDMNALLPQGSPWYLLQACSVNNAGQIIGAGLINGEVHAYLASPISARAALAARGATRPPALPTSVRNAIRQKLLSPMGVSARLH
jgi:probable HAF family extracellular repeat protein